VSPFPHTGQFVGLAVGGGGGGEVGDGGEVGGLGATIQSTSQHLLFPFPQDAVGLASQLALLWGSGSVLHVSASLGSLLLQT